MSAAPGPGRGAAKSTRRIWLIVAGVSLLFVAGAVVLGAVGAKLLIPRALPLTDADRAVLVSAAAIGERLEHFALDPGREVWKKERWFDRSIELTYEYEHPDADDPLHVHTSVSVERSPADAKVTYLAYRAGLGIGLAASTDVEQVERNDLYRWGDESRLVVLTKGGQPVGQVFAARKGTRVFMLSVFGAYVEDGETLGELVGPALESLERYKLE